MILSTTERQPPTKRAYSLQDIREETGLSLPYLRQRVGKELKVIRFGRAIRILAEDYEAFLRSGVEPVKDSK